jgi:hypothetical protein
MRTFAFDFTTTPQVLLCLGRGGFVLLCDLLLLHLGRLLASSPPSCQLTQYLFQYMISFLLRSRYSFIFKGTKSLLICGYVPLCSTRRVLWVLLSLGGRSLASVLRCTYPRALTQNRNSYLQSETISTGVS